MTPSLLLSAALLAPAAPVPHDTVPNATGPAPRVLALKADGGGNVRVVGTVAVKQTVTAIQHVIGANNQVEQKQIEYDTVGHQYFNKTLADFNGKFATAGGTPLTLDEATARIKGGATVLASSDGKPVDKSWLRAVAPDTVVMVADGLSHAQVQWGGEGSALPSTPAPRLALLGTGEKGAPVAQVVTQPAVNGNVYYDDLAFEGRAMKRGIRAWDGGYGYGGVSADAKVGSKPLADVPFDAYDRTGKLVPKADALKRLAAGGMVLVAGDNRMPDDGYLKAFREDVLILVASELVLPIPTLDQTKKKTDPAKPAGAAPGEAKPVLPVAPLMPAVQPLIRINKVAVEAVPVPKK